MRIPSKRKNKTESLKELVNKVLRINRMHSKLDEVEVVLAWKEVFGEVVNKRTRRLILQQDGTLLVTLDSGPLKEEFNQEKEKVAKMLNSHLNRDLVKGVRIR